MMARPRSLGDDAFVDAAEARLVRAKLDEDDLNELVGRTVLPSVK
jgi:hypothetical protein